MLRYLGIPARVAVGFTSGTWKDGTWTVTDHDAHAWVEAWFAGYGWLTFDPTPGRGTLSATYTNASDSADAIRALGTGRFLGAGSFAPTTPRRGVATPEETTSAGIPWRLIVPLGADRRRAARARAREERRAGWRRARTDDPRRRASAARAELAAFMRDQGAAVPPSASIHSSRSSCAAAGSEPMRSRPRSRGPARAAGRRSGGCGRDAAGAAAGPLAPAGTARPGAEGPWLSHGALAPQRVTIRHHRGMSEAYDLYQLGRARLREGLAAQATVPLEKARRLEPDKASVQWLWSAD